MSYEYTKQTRVSKRRHRHGDRERDRPASALSACCRLWPLWLLRLQLVLGGVELLGEVEVLVWKETGVHCERRDGDWALLVLVLVLVLDLLRRWLRGVGVLEGEYGGEREAMWGRCRGRI